MQANGNPPWGLGIIPDKVQEWPHCQIQVQIPILSLLRHPPHFALPGRFGQSLNLLKRDSMACRTPVRKRHRLKVDGVLACMDQLSAAGFICFWFFLLNSTRILRILVSHPWKKSPTHSDIFWWLTSWRSDKAELQVCRQSDEMRGPGSFWRGRLLHPYTTRTTSPSWKQKEPDLTLFTIETLRPFFFPSHTFLCRTHLSVFGVPPSRSARPQIHGNRGQWRNSHKPHSTKGGAFFRHTFLFCICVYKVVTTAHTHKSDVIFHFFQDLSNKKRFKELRLKMTKTASRGTNTPYI